MITQVRKTYKYRLYRNDKCDKHLHDMINIAGIIWNHITALQRRYYRLTGKHVSVGRMKKHIAKLRMETRKYAYWRKLGSQAVQEICERHDKAYARFFKKKGALPQFKKVKKYRSFTLKQSGYKLADADKTKHYRQIKIGKRNYKFVYHRALKGELKTVTIKRDSLGRLWICFSVIESMVIPDEVSSGQIGGFDFGLKTFLVNDEGQSIKAPQFYRDDLPRLQAIQSRVSKKCKSSNNYRSGQKHIARRHIRIHDKRRDFHFQLAHDLCDVYDMLVFEDLNLEGMKRLWGRKVSDLGFAQFLDIVKWVAEKRGKRIIQIDRFETTTQVCSDCGKHHQLSLQDRELNCDCGLQIDRDHNAARNILEAGRCLMLSQSEEDSNSNLSL